MKNGKNRLREPRMGALQSGPYKYHVTFDLDLDFEHTLDAGSPGVHPVQV